MHLQTCCCFKIPGQLNMVDIGKSTKTTVPHFDVKALPNSQIVSRNHARILIEGQSYFIEDLSSTNGTYINGVQLLPGTQHSLQFGDRIGFGSSGKFILIFIHEQPINLEYLSSISGQDITLEKELIQSHLEYAQISLQTIQTALLEKQLEKVGEAAAQLRIASGHVGAQLMQFLAEQLVSKAKAKDFPCSANLVGEIEQALESLRLFVMAYA